MLNALSKLYQSNTKLIPKKYQLKKAHVYATLVIDFLEEILYEKIKDYSVTNFKKYENVSWMTVLSHGQSLNLI